MSGCSDFAHRYAEGHPWERYYRGTSYIDEIENRLKHNLKLLFECDHCEVRPISAHDHPEGIRIGVQEMTRFGMGEEEMLRIAELIKECIIEKRSLKEEVNRFRSGYQEVKYSFDEIVRRKPELVEMKAP
ncbi:MAG: hypothetical protein JSW70_08665 [Syntrophobacterales bacterium]|nr:MAG: hypothetical protein JSW70_08665 [Syntrophobacterales bacterium]